MYLKVALYHFIFLGSSNISVSRPALRQVSIPPAMLIGGLCPALISILAAALERIPVVQ